MQCENINKRGFLQYTNITGDSEDTEKWVMVHQNREHTRKIDLFFYHVHSDAPCIWYTRYSTTKVFTCLYLGQVNKVHRNRTKERVFFTSMIRYRQAKLINTCSQMSMRIKSETNHYSM